MIIKKEQLLQLSNMLKIKFVGKISELFINKPFENLLVITNDALSYKIGSESLIIKYINLYTTNQQIFENKPDWLRSVLQNDEFDADDKITYITTKLTTN